MGIIDSFKHYWLMLGGCVASTRVFGYPLSICRQCKSLVLGVLPNANRNVSGFALQWNIGFRLIDSGSGYRDG